MLIYWTMAALILISIWLHHGDKIMFGFFNLYRKVIKPKYKVGERVMVDGMEWEVLLITKHNPPYIYYCCPVRLNNATIVIDPYIPQKRIKAKTGIFKELD